MKYKIAIAQRFCLFFVYIHVKAKNIRIVCDVRVRMKNGTDMRFIRKKNGADVVAKRGICTVQIRLV